MYLVTRRAGWKGTNALSVPTLRVASDVRRRREMKPSPGRMLLSRAALLATGGAFLLAEVWFAYAHADFFGDDVTALLLRNSKGYWNAVFTPIDVHFVPLQRALTYAVHDVSPMGFGTAVLVLAAFYAAGCGYFWLILRSFGLRRGADLLTWLYVTSPLSFPQFQWWSSGAHRLPYLFCCFGALYHYLAFRRSRSSLHLGLFLVLSIAGIGFYTKGFLIPVALLAIEIAVCIDRWERPPVRCAVALLVSLALAGFVFLLSRPLFPARRGSLRLDVSAVSRFAEAGVQRTALAPLLPLSALTEDRGEGQSRPRLVDPEAPLIPLAWSFWGVVLVASSLGRLRNAGIWAVGVGLVAINAGSIAVSAKAHILGTLIFLVPRFGLETLWIPLLFGGIVLANRSSPPEPRSGRWAVGAAAGLFLCAWPLLSYWKTQRYWTVSSHSSRTSHAYLGNVRAGLARLSPEIETGAVGFADRLVGKPALVVGRVRTSEFLPLFGVRARYGLPAPLYEIDEEGRIVRVELGRRRNGRAGAVGGARASPGHPRVE